MLNIWTLREGAGLPMARHGAGVTVAGVRVGGWSLSSMPPCGYSHARKCGCALRISIFPARSFALPAIETLSYLSIRFTLTDMPVSDISALVRGDAEQPRLIAWEAAVFVC